MVNKANVIHINEKLFHIYEKRARIRLIRIRALFDI